LKDSLDLQSDCPWKFWEIRTAFVDLLTQALIVGSAAPTVTVNPTRRTAAAISVPSDFRRRACDVKPAIGAPLRAVVRPM